MQQLIIIADMNIFTNFYSSVDYFICCFITLVNLRFEQKYLYMTENIYSKETWNSIGKINSDFETYVNRSAFTKENEYQIEPFNYL